jgi:hypothetical protein
MNFDLDAFISYAHMDNVQLIQGHQGWGQPQDRSTHGVRCP